MRDISNIRNEEPHGEDPYSLLRGFFEYYAGFDFKVDAICLREGTVLKKRDSSPIYIYNPLEPTLNVSRNVNFREMENIQVSCRDAAFKLENAQVREYSKSWGIISLFEKVNKTLNVAEVMRDKETEEEKSNVFLVSK